jgi:hypothetical protein
MQLVKWIAIFIIAGQAIALFATPFALIPPAALALAIKARGSRWLIPANRDKRERKVCYVRLGLIGGIAGAFFAFGAVIGAEKWIYYTQHQLCSDWQDGIVWIFAGSFFPLLCSAFALCWTALSFRIPEESVWASLFLYSSERRLMNWVCAGATQIMFWGLFTFCIFRLMVYALL